MKVLLVGVGTVGEAIARLSAGKPWLEQMVLAEYCAPHFATHVPKLTRGLRAKLDTLMEALNEQFGTAAEFEDPKGGIFLWVKLPDNVDTLKLYQAALAASESGWFQRLGFGTNRYTGIVSSSVRLANNSAPLRRSPLTAGSKVAAASRWSVLLSVRAPRKKCARYRGRCRPTSAPPSPRRSRPTSSRSPGRRV